MHETLPKREREEGALYTFQASLTAQLADFRSHSRMVLSREPDKKISSTGDMDNAMTLVSSEQISKAGRVDRTHFRT